MEIERINLAQAEASLPALCTLLRTCVEGGASVGFVLPVSDEEVARFWRSVLPGVATGERSLLVAREKGEIVGTVQVILSGPVNGGHRAEVVKLLVHPKARRRGVARAMMAVVEEEAVIAARSLLVLDTACGSDAEILYRSLGYHQAGVIPGYALSVEGEPHDTVVMAKVLSVSPPIQREGEITIICASPFCPDGRRLVEALSLLLGRRFHSEGRAAFEGWSEEDPRMVFALAYLGEEAVGCGAICPQENDAAELKRLYAVPGTRGVGTAVVAFLEDRARDIGYRRLCLETRWANETAMRFYRRRGFAICPPFGRYVGRPEAACWEKTL